MSDYTKERSVNKLILNIFAFLLGLFACNNIIYVFRVGNTNINIITVYSVLLIFLIFISSYRQINKALLMIPKYWMAFGVLIIFSSVLMFVYFNNYSAYFIRYVNGIIELLLMLNIMLCVLCLKNYKDYIIKGLTLGLMLNLIISIFTYVTFLAGDVFTLTDFFPQGSFYKPTINFRTQGLFLEPSHFLAFIISVIAIIWSSKKWKQIFTPLYVIIFFLVVALSTSGNIPLLALIIILFFTLTRSLKKHNGTNIKFLFITIAGLFIISIIYAMFWEQFLHMVEGVLKGIQGSNLGSEENYGRTYNMLLGLNLYSHYPLGVGYNMSHSLYEINFGRNYVLSSFSFVITILLELGPIGLILYIIIILKMCLPLIFKSTSQYQLAVGISVIGVFLVQAANGYRFVPYMSVVFGLALIELHKLKCEKNQSSHVKRRVIWK